MVLPNLFKKEYASCTFGRDKFGNIRVIKCYGCGTEMWGRFVDLGAYTCPECRNVLHPCEQDQAETIGALSFPDSEGGELTLKENNQI